MSELRTRGARLAHRLAAVRDRKVAEPALLWVLGVALVLLSLFYFWNVLTIPEPPRVLQVSVNAYPLLVAGLMIAAAVLSSVVFGREAMRWRAGEIPASTLGENEVSSWRDLAVGGLGLAALVILMPALGYIVCATVFMIAVAEYFAPKKIVRNILTGVLLALVTYILFDYLGVRLPEGILPIPFDEILPY
jgi:putative tricarboxylic transport membrane protein